MRSPRRDLLNFAEFLKASGYIFAEGEPPLEEVVPATDMPPRKNPPPPAPAAATAKPAPAAPPAVAPAAAAPASSKLPPSRIAVVPISARTPAPAPVGNAPPKWGPILDEAARTAKCAAALKEAEACRACVLGKSRTQAVYSSGGPMSKIMFIGEAPGADEDASGVPFVGRAGQLLTKMIEAIGFSREEVYVCNTLKCRPPENRPPRPEEKAACRHFLMDQIDWIRPQIIVTLGAHASGEITGLKGSIGSQRRKWHDYGGIPLMVTYHPSYLLRDPAQKPHAWDDMKMLHAKYTELNPGDVRKIWAKE